jgi:hypothetical protein
MICTRGRESFFAVIWNEKGAFPLSDARAPGTQWVATMTRTLVTGHRCAGFLGSHLFEPLLTPHDVVCLDDFSTPSEANVTHWSCSALYISCTDICDPLHVSVDLVSEGSA